MLSLFKHLRPFSLLPSRIPTPLALTFMRSNSTVIFGDERGKQVFAREKDDTPCVWVERKDSVYTVVLHRPKQKNAVDRNTAQGLADAFRAFEADHSARVAVLYGENGTFCAGADLKAVAAGQPNRLEAEGDSPMGPCRLNLTKPVIAAVEGFAVAGGLELALWCDLRVASKSAIFGVFCRRFGVPLIDGGTVRLPRLIGQSRAMDLMLTGRPVGISEALSIGLANYIADKGKARERAEGLAAQIAKFPQECMRRDRQSALEQWDCGTFDDALENEFRLGMMVVGSGETVEGATHFTAGEGRHGSFGKSPSPRKQKKNK